MRSKINEFFSEHRFAFFIGACLLITMIMTGISLELYRRSGAIKLDMSRPGYEKVRTEVEKSTDNESFSSTGELDKAAVQEFDKAIDKYQQSLDELGDYDSADISDEDLSL